MQCHSAYAGRSASFAIPSGTELRVPPARYDAATERLARTFAIGFHPALRFEAERMFRDMARIWRPALTLPVAEAC